MVGTGLSLVRGRYLSLVRGRREKTQYYGWHPSLVMGRMRESPWYGWHLCLVRGDRESPWYGWHLCLVRGRQRKPMGRVQYLSLVMGEERENPMVWLAPVSSNGDGSVRETAM